MTRWRSATRHSSVASTGPATPSKQQRTRQVSQSASPPRRRVTRSQSRELKAAGLNGYDPDADVASVVGAGRRAKGKGRRKQDELAVVPEEPPTIIPPKPGPQLDTEVIPESPEDDPANISGTTVLPTDSDAEAGDLDPVTMVDALPYLQRASDDVLEFLIPRPISQASLANLVKQLRDPRSSESRRFKRLKSNFAEQAKHFHFTDQPYIDVRRVARALPSVKVHGASGDSEDRRWHVDVILHKANCARFALEVLTAASLTESAVYNLEGKFPAPFMNGLFGVASEDTVGISDLNRVTFNLALEIRTQFLKVNLERHMFDENFDPDAILRYVFFNEPLDDEDEDEQLSLRGFNLGAFQDEDGGLPTQFQRPVQDRISGIRRYFVNTADGPVDFKGLEAAYPWQGFRFQVAEWIRKRNDEITQQLNQQPSIDKVRDVLHQEVSLRGSFDRSVLVSEHEQEQEQQAENEVLAPPAVEEAVPQQRQRESPPAAESKKKRRSSKGLFFNMDSVRRLSMREREATQGTSEETPRHPSEISDPARSATRKSTVNARGRTVPAASVDEHPAQPGERERSGSVQPVLGVDDDSLYDIFGPDRRDRNVGRSSSTARTTAHPNPRDPRAIWNRTAKRLSNISKQSKDTPPEDSQRRPARDFIDRQANATRISPISLSSGTPTVQQRSPRKRKRVETHDEESEDEEQFSRDERTINVTSKRAQKPEPRLKRRRLDDDYDDHDDDDDDSNDGADLQLQNSLDEVARSTSAQDRDGSEESSTTSHGVRTRRQAVIQRWTSAVDKSDDWTPQPPAQTATVRRRWTAEENERLIKLVEMFGTSWAQLLRLDSIWPRDKGGPKLQGRTQIQLKDRAHNIVLECLRNGEPLPKNFDKIVPRAKDRKRLGLE